MAYREFETNLTYAGKVNVKLREFNFVHGVKVNAVARFACPITHKPVSLDNIILYHSGNTTLPEDKIREKVNKAIGNYIKSAEQLDKDERASNAMNSKLFRKEYKTRRRN